jgi:hypothetical protein
VTVVDTINTPSNTETLTQYNTDASTVEVKGPYATSFFNIAGSFATNGYPSFGALDFNDPNIWGPSGPEEFSPSKPVSAINGITLEVIPTNQGTSGPLNVYLVPDATTNIDPSAPQSANPLYFNTHTVEGLGTQLGAPVLLGQVNWNAGTTPYVLTGIPLINYSQDAENTLIGYLNNGTKFRLVITAGNSTVYASFEGDTIYNGVYEAPQLSINVTEAAAQPALPSYVTASTGAVFTWDAATGNLNLTSGTLTFTADSKTDLADRLVNLSADGSNSRVVFNTTQHLAGISLTNGASATMASLGSARTHDNHNMLVIGAVDATSAATFLVDAASKLDLADNDMIIHNGSLSNVQSAAAAGRNVAPGGVVDGTWDGNGLTSSAAAAADSAAGYEQIGLAVVRNGDQPLGQLDSWTVGGQSEALRADGNDIIVKYTYTGDLALEGAVNDDAATIFNMTFDGGASTGNTWSYGDTNGDGLIDDTDATVFNMLFGNGLASSGLAQL